MPCTSIYSFCLCKNAALLYYDQSKAGTTTGVLRGPWVNFEFAARSAYEQAIVVVIKVAVSSNNRLILGLQAVDRRRVVGAYARDVAPPCRLSMANIKPALLLLYVCAIMLQLLFAEECSASKARPSLSPRG
jgi:hypothetical protein